MSNNPFQSYMANLRSRRGVSFVKALARNIDPRAVGERPIGQRLDRNEKVAAQFRQLIFDTRGHRGKDPSRAKAVTLKVAQSRGQHLVRDAVDLSLQLAETERPRAKEVDNQNGPFVADPSERLADGLAFCGEVEVRRFHRGAFLPGSLVVS